MKTNYNNKNINDLTMKIRDRQLNNNILNSSIDNIQYNENSNFNPNKYAIPQKDKLNLLQYFNTNQNNTNKLLEKSQIITDEYLQASEKFKFTNDFIKNLHNNNNKTIKVKDFINNKCDILIVYSTAGLKMLHIDFCNIIGCDATFIISPQLKLWKEINKSYQQVNNYKYLI